MGGGGGSSTYTTGTASPGGRGGGIVIIVTDAIIGNGKYIKADGQSASGAASFGGAGGGGGGGSVVLSLQSYSASQLNLSVKGGNGGAHTSFSGGGGGGGGDIWVSKPIAGEPVTTFMTGGTAGTSATSGAAGEVRATSFKALLNGFLFNSIRSSITLNQVDSICSNVTPKEITGTSPVGGTSPYTYLWERSPDNSVWSTIGGATSPNYIPSAVEPATFYIRRTITDASGPPLVDVSKSVQIIVHPAITGNVIGTDQIICYNQDPVVIGQLLPTLIGGGSGSRYAYLWRNNGTSTDAPGINNLPSGAYDPPPLTLTTFFVRKVTSGRCVDVSAPVQITVLDSISNNKILSLPQEICYGSAFTDLTATTAATTPALAGGDNVYRF